MDDFSCKGHKTVFSINLQIADHFFSGHVVLFFCNFAIGY